MNDEVVGDMEFSESSSFVDFESKRCAATPISAFSLEGVLNYHFA